MPRTPSEPLPVADRDAQTATLARGDTTTRTPLGAIVRVIGVKASPAFYRLTSGACLVGSGPPCDIQISEPTVSRVHAELHLVAEGVGIRDMGSRNGTFYLGQRVEKMILSLGARVEVGAATLAVEADGSLLGDGLEYPEGTYRGIIGKSSAMRRIFGMLSRLEGSLVTVLIEGDSGVGKEVIAHALHQGSPVGSGPMVTVNCGAIPRDLVASELLGHRRGAFTGAVDDRAGAFEQADGGTLFLDEIGELPVAVQPALLRVLETGEVQRVGGEKARHVRVRVIAATNRSLEQEIAGGSFREDLFYRLAVVRLHVPPLRERVEDIEPLAIRFAKAMDLRELPGDVIEQLKARPWPGNARELRNAVQAYAALGVLPQPSRSKAATLQLALLEFVDLARPYAAQKDELTDRFTKSYLEALLSHTGGNQSAAARVAGLDRTYLGRLVVKYGLGKSDGTEPPRGS